MIATIGEQFTLNFSLVRVLSPYLREKSIANSSPMAFSIYI